LRVQKRNLLSEPLCIFAKLKNAPDRALVTFAVFSAIALILFPSDGWSQQDGQPAVQRHVRAREQAATPAGTDATSSAPAAQGAQAAGQRWHTRVREKPATPPTAEADPTSSTAQAQGAQTGAQHLTPGRPKDQPDSAALDPSSSLAQALALCDKNAADQDTFALPGLRGAVTLDRCYKGRGHLLCVFGAFIAEAKSLTDSYTKIADAKYPEFNTVANICQIKSATLAADIAGSEDFNRRFAGLKSKYESASKCAANVKQSFRDVVLSDMAQPPEILKSMSESIEGDITRVSDSENQIVGLAAKMEAANKAMATIEKIHRAMCVKEKDDAISSAANADQTAH
jgi:hypothetical protein